jgi:putative peptide maturation dehydrogenase
MLLRRPTHLRFEYREAPQFSLQNLVAGGGGVECEGRWLATAAHFDGEIELELEDLALVQLIPEAGIAAAGLPASVEPGRIRRLLDAGVLLADDEVHAAHSREDAKIRRLGWWGPAAIAQRAARWDGVDVSAAEASEGRRRVGQMIEENGLPPSEAPWHAALPDRISLPSPPPSGLDALLHARSTCRNFDAGFELPLADVAALLHRVFAAQASHEIVPGAVMLKKNSPSGGGLHPVEAFVLVQRVQGLQPGLYHYHCVDHALEPMGELDAAGAARAAYELVAGQSWFANAPVLVLMAARFERTFWKYRNHVKAWKVIQLDAGHLSQNLYLSATELGYGAFITGAINDVCAEKLFGLDGIGTGAIAVCGFGKRAASGDHVEFDPLGKAVR